MIWDDVRFVFMIIVMGFSFPFATVLGLVTADYVICNTITSCDNVIKVKVDEKND